MDHERHAAPPAPEIVRAFTALTTGIYVLTVRDGAVRHGMSVSWVTPVSADPPRIAVAVDPRHWSHGAIERTQRFALNVVGEKGRHLEDYFHAAPAQPDKLTGVATEDSPTGLPILAGAMVSIECRVEDRYVVGDHTLFVVSVGHVAWRGSDRCLTSQDLGYLYVGQVVKRPG